MRNRDIDALIALSMVTQLGVIMVASILVGLLAGIYLDRQFGTAPVLTLALMLIGVAGGMTAAYKLIMKVVNRRADDGSEPDGKSPDGGDA
jgi:ATP synthase protein I